jgi:outer membrane receptor protein involved in Fe transport
LERVGLDGESLDTSLDDFGQGFDAVLPIVAAHSFERVNPALGFTLTPEHDLTLYADYNEGNRAPTVIELGCADPKRPCGLPDDFASDPDLKQVVAHTLEAGARGGDQKFAWSADVFRTRNSDDIQFVTSAAANAQGYFANVGDTRRQGIDLGLGGKDGPWDWHLSLSWLDATFESSFQEADADSNSAADAQGEITIRSGDHIPLIPERSGRFVLDYEFDSRWHAGGGMVYASSVFLHGDEDNANVAGQTNAVGNFVEGSGRIGGYAVFDLHGDYQASAHLGLFLRVTNVFDRKYATAGFLSNNVFRSDGRFRADGSSTSEDAVSPAAPRALWVGITYRW